MSLDKAIDHEKEHRKRYRGAKSVDPHCRNHGYCPRCKNNRLYSSKKRLEAVKEKIEYEKHF